MEIAGLTSPVGAQKKWIEKKMDFETVLSDERHRAGGLTIN